jgi:flagellar motility protein MotE (MotC chaperone)
MISAFLYFWLATGGPATSANTAAAKAAPTAPQIPEPPAAPAVKGPPLPALPDLLLPGDQPSPQKGKPGKKSLESDGPHEAPGEGASGKDGGRPAGKTSKKSAPPAPQGRGVPSLPGLSTSALKNELRTSLSGSTEPGQVSERARLEQLAAEIAKARESLRQETNHLEELIQKRGSCDGELRSAAAAAAAAGSAQNADAAAAKDAEREQMDSVSKAMKGMKPEQAAAVVTRLDHRLASEILRRMRPADAGAVLGFLRPELAAELATEIATRKPSFAAKKGAANP